MFFKQQTDTIIILVMVTVLVVLEGLLKVVVSVEEI